jgi:ligand-binding sensor domain-containing protein/signal transduction histidine kinase
MNSLNTHKNQFEKMAVIIFVLILFQAVGNSQNDASFTQLSLEKGVALNLTYDMLQDSEGYLWFGTMYGLVRYDGINYKTFTYNPRNSESISFDDVISIFEDSKGNLWIGTWGGGLNKLDAKRKSFKRFVYDPSVENGISDNIIWAITEDTNGNIWLGTEAGGLNKYDPSLNKFIQYEIVSANSSLPNKAVRSLFVDSDGTIWAGGWFGLSKYSHLQDKFEATSVSNKGKKSPFGVNSIFQNSSNSLLLGTNRGLYTFDKCKNNFNSIKLLPEIGINSIAEDHLGKLWLATVNGLIKYDQNEKTYFFYKSSEDPNSLSSNFIKNVIEDQSGVLWVNSYNSGISKLINRKSNFALIQHSEENLNTLSSNRITSLAEDKDGSIWIGTRNGLNRYDAVVERIANSKLEGKPISALAIDGNNILWISSRNELLKYNYGKDRVSQIKNKSLIKKLKNKTINNLLFDSNGRLWIGTYSSGLYLFNKEKLEHFSLINEKSKSKAVDYILSIYEDNNGKIWIGTYGGLHLFNPDDKSFNSFVQELNNPKSLSNNYVYSITEDSNGRLWIGTARGLNFFDPQSKTFKAFYEQDGLPNDVICGIVEDKTNNLWISTINGISRFNPEENSFQNFEKEDGLQSNLFNQDVYLKGSNGEIYFGGRNGLNVFDPANVKVNTFNSPVIISSLSLIKSDGELQNLDLVNEQLDLDYDQNSLQINVLSFDYSNPERIKYKYKLSGYEENWIDLGTENKIIFQNLPSGSYSLLVKGTNGDGIWSKHQASLSILIATPFWQTAWFYLIIALVLIIISIIVHRVIVKSKVKRAVRIEKIREEEAEKVRRKTAIDFHDELGHRLTRISLLTELIKRNIGNAFSEITTLLNQISDNSTQLYTGTQDFIWAIDPKQETLYELMLRLKDFGDDLYGLTDIKFEVNGLDENLQAAKLDVDWKRHLALIFKEGMNNSLKHSKGEKVQLDSHLVGDEIEIVLSDNGKGFAEDPKSKGNGLKNMRDRAEKLASSIFIDSNPGKGTKISFKGKFPVKSVNFN